MAGPTIASAEVDVTLDGRGLPAQAKRIANQAGKVLEPAMGDVGDRVGQAFIVGMNGQMRSVPKNALRAIREIDTRGIGRERGVDLADSLGDGIVSRSQAIASSLAQALAGGDFEGQGNLAGESFTQGLRERLEAGQRAQIGNLIQQMLSGFGNTGDRAGSALAERFSAAFNRNLLAGMDRTVALVLRLLGSIGPQLVALTSGLSASLVGLISSAFIGLSGALLTVGGPLIAARVATSLLNGQMKDLLKTSEDLKSAVDGLKGAWDEQGEALAAVAVTGIVPLLNALREVIAQSSFGEALGASIAAIAAAFTEVVGSPGFSAFITAMETTFPAALTLFGTAIASITEALLTLFAAAGPAAVELGEAFAGWADRFNTAISALNASGGLASFFDTALASLSALMGFIGPLAQALGNVFLLGAASGNRMLTTLGELAGQFLAFTQSIAGQNAIEEWFAGGEQIFNALLPLIGSLSTALAAMVTPAVLTQVENFLGSLGELIPVVLQVLSVIGELDLLNIVANILLGIGNAITPLLPALSELASAIGAIDPSVWQAMGIAILVFVAALRLVGTVIGPLRALFTLLSSGATVGTVLRAVVTGITVAVRALFAALVANPIGLVIAAIAALVAGLIYFFTQTETGRAAWASFVSWLQDLWAGLSEWFTGTFVPAMQAVWDGIIAGVQSVGAFFTAAWQGLLNAPQALLDWFTGTFVPFIASLPGLVATGLGAMVGFFLSLPGRIIGAVATLISWWIGFWVNFWVTAINLITTGIQNTIVFFTTLPERVQALWASFQAWWKAFWPALWAAGIAAVQRGVIAVIVWFNNLVSRAQATVRLLQVAVPLLLRIMWERAVAAVQSGIQRALSAVTNFVSGFIGFITDLGAKFFRAMTSAMSEGDKAAVAGVADLLGTIGRIPGQIGSALGNLGSTLYGAGQDLIQGLINGVASMAGSLFAEAQRIADVVIDTVSSAFELGSPSKLFKRMGQDVVAGLDQGLDPTPAQQAADALARSTVGAFENTVASTTNTYGNTRNNNVAAGAIQIFTQTTDPEIAANMVLDRLVGRLA